MDFFSGEASIVRVMGYLRVHYVTISDNASGAYNNRQVEVRAWLCKTTQQDTNNRIGYFHPFAITDFDTRVVWSASWLSAVKLRPSPTTNGVIQLGEGIEAPTGGAFLLERGSVNANTMGSNVRRVSIRQPIKMKGNDRLTLMLACGPWPDENNIIGVFMSGYSRMLIRH